ncbi:MAG: hypothetical protein M3076_14180 [Actinomycetota bacterium]|nr:hypothetical protein [Actinomycetota bacterium]
MRTWGEIRAEQIVDEGKPAAYARIMEAEEKVYELIVEAAGGGEGPEQDEFFGDGGEALWVANLGRHVAALGGHVELCAVFPDRRVTLLQEPGPVEASGPSA